MELPIRRTENVKTQFRSKLLLINSKSVLPKNQYVHTKQFIWSG